VLSITVPVFDLGRSFENFRSGKSPDMSGKNLEKAGSLFSNFIGTLCRVQMRSCHGLKPDKVFCETAPDTLLSRIGVVIRNQCVETESLTCLCAWPTSLSLCSLPRACLKQVHHVDQTSHVVVLYSVSPPVWESVKIYILYACGSLTSKLMVREIEGPGAILDEMHQEALNLACVGYEPRQWRHKVT